MKFKDWLIAALVILTMIGGVGWVLFFESEAYLGRERSKRTEIEKKCLSQIQIYQEVFKSYAESDLAVVQELSDIKIYIMASPLDEFEQLGIIENNNGIFSKSPEQLIRDAVKRGKREYWGMNGLVFRNSNLINPVAIKIDFDKRVAKKLQ